MMYGLIGEKLGHSFSKEIHAAIADYKYELCELSRSEVEEFFRSREFKAINVTIPYKETVIPLLDEISEKARRIGAVNTVVNRGGKLYGYNTDYYGAASLIRRTGIGIKDKKVLILGTGGTSKTLSAVASDMGAREIVFVSRSSGESTVSYEEAAERHSDAHVIINTTPVGMYPENGKCPINIGAFPELEGVLDVIYNPLKTRLVREAEMRGLPASGGLYMLAAQAVYASAFFRDIDADDALSEKAYRAVLEKKQNIVLVGMPSCGKTTVGALLSKKLGMEVYDTDAEVVAQTGKAITDIFREEGEAAFRRYERDAIAEVSKKSGVIIASGGGAILAPENVDGFRQNGRIFFLDRPLEKLIATSDRPLSSDTEALKKRYDERYPIYCKVADVRIDASCSAEQVADLIIEEMKR